MAQFLKVFFVLAVLLSGLDASAQAVSEMAFTELVAAAEAAVKDQQSAAAVPFLKEIIGRAELIEDEQAKESVQMARLQIGMALADLKKTEEARQYIQRYLKETPCKKPEIAIQILCQILADSGEWQELYDTALQIVNDKQIAIRHKPPARMFLVQALFELGEYDRALEMLPGVLAEAKDEATVNALKVMQLRAMLETGNVAEGIEFLSSLFRGDAQYDLTLNLTLLRMGDKMFDSQRYNQARVLYGKMTPRSELIQWMDQEISAMERANEKRKEWREEDTLRVKLLKKNKGQLNDIPDYSVYIGYRIAQIFAEQKRYWEAAALFDRLYQEQPNSNEGQGSFLQKVLLLFELDQVDEAVAISKEYIQRNTSGLYPRLVCAQLMQHYILLQQYENVLSLVGFMDRWSRPSGGEEIQQETTLRYMVGFAYFKTGSYEKAYVAFDRVVRLNSNSKAGMDSGYWKAMCRLLQMKYTEAYEAFVRYHQAWPRATFAPAALFRAGVCRFGLEEYAEAKNVFKEFVDTYPHDALMPEALTMRADLQAADGEIDEALVSYRRAIQVVKSNYSNLSDSTLKKQIVLPATYAAIQAAQVLEADAKVYQEEKEYVTATEKLREIITLVEMYLNDFGEDSDWAQGVFWVGRAQVKLGEVDQAVASYLDAVVRFGVDPAQEGVADILFDLAGIIERKLPSEQREQTVKSILEARQSAATPALQIRLDVLLAELNKTDDELGPALLAREKDLTVVPPTGLSLMCGALLEREDYSRSQEFFDLFAANYEGSVFMKNAYQLRGEDLYRQGKIDEALELAEGALAQYGGTFGTGWAQLMKGRIQFQLEDYEGAEKTFKSVFNVGAWRGAISAEATYRLATVQYQRGNYLKAHAFFQRTYLLYKAYKDGQWAAESYLGCADCLIAMGREADARNTYRAMLLDEYVKDHPRAAVAREALGSQEVAELMSAGTNAMEAVESKVEL